MYLYSNLTDKINRNGSEYFKIIDINGNYKNMFIVRHHELTIDNIKAKASHTIGYRKNKKVYFEMVDEYSSNLLMLVYGDNKIEKFIIFK